MYVKNPFIDTYLQVLNALCSRNFQNVKLRLDFVEIQSFYRHQNFTQNEIWRIQTIQKMSFVAILDTEL